MGKSGLHGWIKMEFTSGWIMMKEQSSSRGSGVFVHELECKESIAETRNRKSG